MAAVVAAGGPVEWVVAVGRWVCCGGCVARRWRGWGKLGHWRLSEVAPLTERANSLRKLLGPHALICISVSYTILGMDLSVAGPLRNYEAER